MGLISLMFSVMKSLSLPRTIWCLILIGSNLSATFTPALLDGQEPQHVTHIESEHDPEVCGTEFERSVCKHNSSEKLFSRGIVYVFGEGDHRSLDYFEHPLDPFARVPSLLGHHDRAPPTI